MIRLSEHQDRTTLVMSPNASLNWQQSKRMIIIVMVMSGLIALYCLFQGAWLVLPFAGLENLLFACCIYHVCRSQQQRHVLTLTGDEIIIETGLGRPLTTVTWSRDRTRFELDVSNGGHLRPALLISCGDQQQALGHFLNREDRLELQRMLEQCGIRLSADMTTLRRSRI